MEGLDFGVMLDDDQVESLFGEQQDDTQPDKKEEGDEEKDNKKDTAEVDPDDIFGNKPESVGSEDNQDKKEDTSDAEDSTSPDFFSSIANAFAEEGIFPDLDEDTIKGIKTAQDFRNAINEQIKAGLDLQQKRIIEALDNNVEPDVIKQFEGVLSYLNSIDEDTLSAEGDKGENLRKKLLYQDYINRGFSKERAEKAVNRAIANGTDVEDAKEALESSKTYFVNKYRELLEEAKKAREEDDKEREKIATEIRKNILEGSIKMFEDVDLDKSIRQKAYDAIAKPVYKDPSTGEYYTAIQKMEMENRNDFMAKLGLIYALTDGFKSIDGLVKKKVKKEVKKGFSELEQRINNTRRDSRGNLRFTSGVDDTESILGKGIKLDL